MPSQLHESLIALFRNCPEMVYALVRDHLQVSIPAPRQVAVAEAGLSEIEPPEYRADLVLVGGGAPSVIVEIQLQKDEEKRLTWPMYVVGLGARVAGGAVLVVVSPSRAVAKWAEEPIETGHPGFTLRPLVLGPATIPAITDPKQASAAPELAVLSAIAHGKGKQGRAVGHSALVAVSGLDAARARFYADLVFSELSAAARKALERNLMDKPYEYQSDFARRYIAMGREEGREQGIEQGERALLLRLLERRFGALPDPVRQRVDAASATEVEAWADRLLLADSLEAIFGKG